MRLTATGATGKALTPLAEGLALAVAPDNMVEAISIATGAGGAHGMTHVPHPHIEARKAHGVHTTKRERSGFNGWLALTITNSVGTMWCAYAFAVLALISLPDAIKTGTAALIAWIAQTFLQLVLLSIIMVGQKVSAAASDKQAFQTYMDAEALLEISNDIHKLLASNTSLTEEIHKAMAEKTTGGSH